MARVSSTDDVPVLTLGGGAPGTFGEPLLAVDGEPAANAVITARVSAAQPGALVLLVFGNRYKGWPVHSGLLGPGLDAVLPGVTDGSGAWTHVDSGPIDAPHGDLLHLQAWVHDGGAAGGWAASDTIQFTAQ